MNRWLYWIEQGQSVVSVGSNLSLRFHNDTVFHRRTAELCCNGQKVLDIKGAQRKETQLMLYRIWQPWVASHNITAVRT